MYLTEPYGCAAGPFNNQPGRRAMVEALVRAVRPQAVYETGTFLGHTTRALAAMLPDLEVWTCDPCPEVPWLHAPGIVRLAVYGVEMLAMAGLSQRAKAPVLAYLDGHNEQMNPVLAEVGTVTGLWTAGAIVIDDCSVPHDGGYKADNCGGRPLSPRMLARVANGYALYAPTCPSADEPEPRTGCCVMIGPGLGRANPCPDHLVRIEDDWLSEGE